MSEPISCKAKRRRFQKPIIRIHLSISVTIRGNSAGSIILPRTIHVSVFRKRAGTAAKFTMPRVFILSMQNVTYERKDPSNRRDFWINRASIPTCLMKDSSNPEVRNGNPQLSGQGHHRRIQCLFEGSIDWADLLCCQLGSVPHHCDCDEGTS